MKSEVHAIRLAHMVGRLGLAGTELGVIKQPNAVVEIQFEVTIFCLDGHDDNVLFVISDKIELIDVRRKRGVDWRLIIRLARAFRKSRLEIVYFHNWTTFFYSVLAARLISVPVILHAENGRDNEQYDHDLRKHLARKFLASQCDQRTTVSSEISRILRDVWQIPAWKIVYIPNGVNLNMFNPNGDGCAAKESLGLDRKSPAIGTVIGRIRPVKDVATLIKAFKLIHTKIPAASLIVVGHGPQLNEFKKMATEL